jgi:hypothetical protein
MFSLKPERSEVFYDISLYGIADFVVTSSMVKTRYLKEPDRFRRQISFYGELEREFERVKEFLPDGRPGPAVTVYRNPRQRVPFGGRGQVRPPPVLRHEGTMYSGSEELFYKNLGVNYEVFQYYREALAAYELAFEYPIVRPDVLNLLVIRKTLCLVALGRDREAVEYLAVMSDRVPPETGEKFSQMRGMLLDRMNRRNRESQR